eukprot:11684424-Alexandrium_andersonii.AAC.1
MGQPAAETCGRARCTPPGRRGAAGNGSCSEGWPCYPEAGCLALMGEQKELGGGAGPRARAAQRRARAGWRIPRPE